MPDPTPQGESLDDIIERLSSRKRPRGKVGRMWWDRAIQEALAIARRRQKICEDEVTRHKEGSRAQATERCAMMEAGYIADQIKGLMSKPPA